MNTAQTKTNPESTHHSVKNTGKQSLWFFNTSHESPFFSPATIQPKLKIGPPDDKYEWQADRMADTVVSSPAPDIQQQSGEDEEEMLQMKCSECEKEHELQMKREPILHRKCKECEEEINIQKKANDSSGAEITAVDQISHQLQTSRGSGNRLPESIQSEMSQKIGADFRDVNIYTNSGSAELNRSLGARAFTHGNDIYFNSGEYRPETQTGRHLLAHELVHVVQQNYTPEIQQIQRTIGDGHDLQSSRFSQDSKLEAVYDNEDLVKIGERGLHIMKLQQALVDLGYPLKNFGVDGIFGSETKGEIKAYQNEHSLTVDGIVGPKTMESLDRQFRNDTTDVIDNLCTFLLDQGRAIDSSKSLFPVDKQPPYFSNLLKNAPTSNIKGIGPVFICGDLGQEDGCIDEEGNVICKDICNRPKATIHKPNISFFLCDDNVITNKAVLKVLPGCGSNIGGKGGQIGFIGSIWEITPETDSCACGNNEKEQETERKKWEWGFSQTVENARYGGVYTTGFAEASAPGSRDALVTKTGSKQNIPPPPWYDFPGNPFGPKNVADTSPQIKDTPNIILESEHPKHPKSKLSKVCMNGRFNIFLLLTRANVKAKSSSDVDFFYHWVVEFDSIFSLKNNADPCSPSGWSKSGSPKIKAKGKGAGPKFVFDQPVANIAGKKIDYNTTVNPCNK